MTKQENMKCEEVLKEAIAAAEWSKEEYALSEQYYKEGDTIKGKTEQRKADNHRGYAEGINQVLAVLNFQGEDLKELQKLVD